METNSGYWTDEQAQTILGSFIGKTISSIDYTGKYSAAITIHFTDNSSINIDAEGDDMAHTVIDVNIK